MGARITRRRLRAAPESAVAIRGAVPRRKGPGRFSLLAGKPRKFDNLFVEIGFRVTFRSSVSRRRRFRAPPGGGPKKEFADASLAQPIEKSRFSVKDGRKWKAFPRHWSVPRASSTCRRPVFESARRVVSARLSPQSLR